MSAPAREEVLAWVRRVEAWEDEVVADARLAGALPVADYADMPFRVPPEVAAALRDLRDPDWRERRRRAGEDARREAARRRALAAFLRERGDEAGAGAQGAAAARFDLVAAEVDADLALAR